MWEGALFSPLAQFGERVWWMPLQPSNRRLGPLDSRFEQGRFLGPMDGSNTVFVGTASGVVKATNNQTIAARRAMNWQLAGRSTRQRIVTKCTGRRWRQSWDQSACVATTCAVPLPPVVPEFRLVERQCAEPTSRSSAYTDCCPGCAIARAGRKQAVDHSEQCRSRMETTLLTITEGHERLERARDRFAQAAKEPGVEESQRKRHRPEGEGGCLSRHQHRVSEATTRKVVAAAAVRRCHRPLNRHHLQNEIWTRKPK